MQVIFNAATSKFVLVFHCEDGPYQVGLRGVASSSSAAGPFTWSGAARANDLYSMDMTEYIDPNDPDRTAYHVRTARVQPGPNIQWTVGSKLSADYLSIAPGPVCFNTSTHTEGPAVLFHSGAYYLFGSHLTGLGANPARVLRCKARTLSECCTPLGAPTKWTGACDAVRWAVGWAARHKRCVQAVLLALKRMLPSCRVPHSTLCRIPQRCVGSLGVMPTTRSLARSLAHSHSPTQSLNHVNQIWATRPSGQATTRRAKARK